GRRHPLLHVESRVLTLLQRGEDLRASAQLAVVAAEQPPGDPGEPGQRGTRVMAGVTSDAGHEQEPWHRHRGRPFHLFTDNLVAREDPYERCGVPGTPTRARSSYGPALTLAGLQGWPGTDERTTDAGKMNGASDMAATGRTAARS